MDFFLEFAVPVQVAIITGLIGAVTIILNTWMGKGNLLSLKQRRYIDTISSERIDWLNKIRESFIKYSMLSTEMAMQINIFGIKNFTVANEESKKAIDLLIKLNAERQKIHLLLNPVETFPSLLNELMEDMADLLSGEFGPDEFNNINKDIYFVQQVILKAEWKRIGVEIEKGSSLTQKRVKEIYKEVGERIDAPKLNELILTKLK